MEILPSLYREVFANSDAAMAVLSPHGEWLAVNPALCRLVERPVYALLGMRTHDALFDADSARWIAALCKACPAKADPLAGHVRAVAHPGPGAEPSWRISLTRIEETGGEPAMLLQIEDARDGTRLRQDHHEAARIQEHIAFGISHDLRAPLRSITGFAARLDASDAFQDPAARADLARIRAAATRAEHLIEELLELMRIPRQSLRDEDVDVSLLCDWIVSELQDAEPSRSASVQVPDGLQARGDEHWLKVMLHKLLDNAWKFSAGRERVEIRIDGAVVDGRLRLSIEDRGSGFDMRYADKLFFPFQRLHGADQGGGSGLGLAVAQQVAHRHGGSIRADSQPGVGSTFHVELPAAAGDGQFKDHDTP